MKNKMRLSINNSSSSGNKMKLSINNSSSSGNKMRLSIIMAILFAALMIMLPAISAVAIDPDLVYKQYSQADLKIPCYNNGTWCSAAAICNLTVSMPNGTILVKNGKMTNQGSFHNYTLSPSQTTVIGVYQDSMVCLDNGYNGKSSFEHEIRNSDWTIMILYGIAGLIYLMLVIFAWKTELSWIGFLAGVILSLPGIHLMIYGFGGYDDLLVRGMATVILAVSLLSIVIFAYEALSEYSDDGSGNTGGGGDAGSSGGEDYDYFKS